MSQESQPLVSIVIPCYNHAEFVQDCIRSVIDQTYQNIELIIIDDGSKDNSVEKIRELFNQCKARFTRFEFRYRPNLGLSATLNEALEWCQGKYYSAIASDDMMLVDKTKIQVHAIEKNQELLGVFGNVVLVDENKKILGRTQKKERYFVFNDLFYTENSLTAPTQLLRLEKVKNVGFKNGYILEDWYLYLKLSENGGKFLFLEDEFSYYRRHSSNISDNKFKMTLGGFQVMNEFLHLEDIEKKYIQESCHMLVISLKSNFKYTVMYFFSMIMKIVFKNK